jgi:hypothetical protein
MARQLKSILTGHPQRHQDQVRLFLSQTLEGLVRILSGHSRCSRFLTNRTAP